MIFLSLPWILLPGLGQIHLGFPAKGVVLFASFALLLNGYLIIPLVADQLVIRVILGILTAGFWLVSAVDFIWLRLHIRPMPRRHHDEID
ncbi:MAG: hypothetical protein HY716_10920 [Planctomycetes bacterium]|nr:hypothetical protein [Planctomycetota bacterium]